MSDHRSKKPGEQRRISLGEDHEVRYWTKELGVTKEELLRLIEEFGDSADAVRRALDKPHLGKPHRFRPKPRTL